MLSPKILFGAMFALTQLAGTAHAGSDTTLLLNQKAWKAEHTYYHDTGWQACHAYTFEREGDKFSYFSVTSRQDSTFVLRIVTNRPLWKASFTDDLVLSADYNTLTLHNAHFGVNESNLPYVDFEFFPGRQRVEFVGHLYDSSVIQLKDSEGNRSLINWSLAGAATALSKLTECYQRIDLNGNSVPVNGYGPEKRSTDFGYGLN